MHDLSLALRFVMTNPGLISHHNVITFQMPIRGHLCCSISCLRTHATQTVELKATDYAYAWLMFNSSAIYVTVTIPSIRNMALASSSFTVG